MFHKRICLIGILSVYCICAFCQAPAPSVSLADVKAMPEKARIIALNQLSKKYNADSTDLSIELAEEAYALAVKYKDRRQEGIALVNMAEGYLYNDLYDKAFLCNAEALEIFNQLGFPADAALALTSLGWLYYDVEDPQNSLAYHQKTLDILRHSLDKERLSAAFNAVGLAHALGKNYDKAMPFFKESLALGTSAGSQVRISESLDNIGEAAMELGRYEESLASLKESYQLSKSLDDRLRQAETLNHMARVLILLKKFKESEQYLTAARKLIDISNSNSKKEMLLENALIGTDLYEATGDFRQSLKRFREYRDIRNEILSEAKKYRLAQSRIAYEEKKREEEVERLETEKEERMLQRNALGAVIVLLAVVGGLVISLQSNARKREKQLSEAREALMRKDIEKEKLEKEALNSKLEYKNNEIINFALHISQRNDLLRIFLEELAAVQSAASAEIASKLGKIIHQFKQIQEVNEDAERFHLSIEAAHKEFFFKLTQSFPDLTKNEKRLCAQIRLNLSIKDIASINNISVKSVEMARYRLRKRFKIGHDEIFIEWLKQF